MPRFILAIIAILAVIIFLVLVTAFIANYFFNRLAKEEGESLFTKSRGAHKEVIKEAHIGKLPGSVQRWLKYSQVLEKERIVTAKIIQEAEMRLKKEQSWMPLISEQYFVADEPGFVWNAKVKAAPLIHIAGKDKYVEGKGNMLIKLMSLITVADEKGKEVDQGTLLRFLAETVWLPTAALESYIKWEVLSDNSAKATMTYGGITASGVFTFGANGQVENFTAQRFKEFKGEYSLETWSIDVSAYKDFNGIKIPTTGRITWKLKDGDFNWYNFKVINVEYN